MAVFLIDTNALVFAFTGSPRLSAAAADILGDQGHERLVSPASLYEIALKHRRGKLPVDPADAQRAITRSGLHTVPPSAETMIAAATLAWDNRDPWDRIIAASTMVAGARLVSSDAAFDALAGLGRVW